jgi:hypothetical protein
LEGEEPPAAKGEVDAEAKMAQAKARQKRIEDAKRNLKLQSRGFTKVKGLPGFTFPGIDPEEIDKAIRAKKD